MKVIKRVLILVCLILSAAPVLHGTRLKSGLKVMVRSSVLSADTAKAYLAYVRFKEYSDEWLILRAIKLGDKHIMSEMNHKIQCCRLYS